MVVHNQSGYVGSSMSVRAAEAYSDGKKPLSKWSKADILEAARGEGASDELIERLAKRSLSDLRASALFSSEWHHTSKFLNETDFYEIKDLEDLEEIPSEKKVLVNVAKVEKGLFEEGQEIGRDYLKGVVYGDFDFKKELPYKAERYEIFSCSLLIRDEKGIGVSELFGSKEKGFLSIVEGKEAK